MRLSDLKAGSNTKQTLLLPVASHYPIEMTVICGSCPGKTLVVTAGVHGCEYVGIETLNRLKKELEIPVFHDDQHGTAIACLSAVLGALRFVKKDIATAKFVVNGCGAAGSRSGRGRSSGGAGRTAAGGQGSSGTHNTHSGQERTTRDLFHGNFLSSCVS